MPGNRRNRKTYTESQISGMKAVAEICRNTRESFGTNRFETGTLRQWVAFLAQQSEQEFSIHDIRRYETAGENTDKRAQTINTIPDRYLEAIAPFTGYPYSYLRDLRDGISVATLRETPDLRQLLEERKEELGSARYRKLLNTWKLTDEKIDATLNKGVFYEGSDAAFSAVLGVPVDVIHDATAATLLARLGMKSEEDSLGVE